jgi:hypothetical protein
MLKTSNANAPQLLLILMLTTNVSHVTPLEFGTLLERNVLPVLLDSTLTKTPGNVFAQLKDLT